MMLGARTAAWAKSGGAPLPYDAEVEWIENPSDFTSGNGSYILSVFRCREVYGYEVDFSQSASGGTYSHAFGCYDNGIQIYDYHSAMPEIPSLGISWTDASANFDYNNIASCKWIDGFLVCKGINGTKEKEAPGPIDSDLVFGIFGHVLSNGLVQNVRVRNHGVTLYGVGRNKLVDCIPVRFTNENGVNEGAMYDRVSGQLFRNQGTGAFVIGPDKTT